MFGRTYILRIGSNFLLGHLELYRLPGASRMLLDGAYGQEPSSIVRSRRERP